MPESKRVPEPLAGHHTPADGSIPRANELTASSGACHKDVLISSRALLNTYPRKRPPLASEYTAVYVDHYRMNRAGTGGLGAVVRRLERWMHRAVAEDAGDGRLLELGAGSFNHVPYEKTHVYDAVEPFAELGADSPHRDSVRTVYRSIAEVPQDACYDRIISVAVLEHLIDLPWVVARCGELLAAGGRFQAGIPSEGGMLWGVGWRATTAPAFRLRRGLPYGPLLKHEHVNTGPEIETVVRHFFKDVRLRRFPTPLFHLSFYASIDAREPRLERCRTYCQSRPLVEEQ